MPKESEIRTIIKQAILRILLDGNKYRNSDLIGPLLKILNLNDDDYFRYQTRRRNKHDTTKCNDALKYLVYQELNESVKSLKKKGKIFFDEQSNYHDYYIQQSGIDTIVPDYPFDRETTLRLLSEKAYFIVPDDQIEDEKQNYLLKHEKLPSMIDYQVHEQNHHEDHTHEDGLTERLFPRNLIITGIPGCGKSHYIDNILLKEHSFLEDNIIRTVFHSEYSNTDFIGQIMPTEKATYKFNPGPFTIALKKASDPEKNNVALVIEELNRGNAPAIFGEIFQLLDRSDKVGCEGDSEYGIICPHVAKFISGNNSNNTMI